MYLAPAVTFALYIVIAIYQRNTTLLTGQAFTSIALISLLTSPVVQFIQSLPRVVQCVASFDRIQEFYNYTAGKCSDEDPKDELQNLSTLSFNGASFGWTLATPVLEDLRCEFMTGRVTAVVGPVASGKSSLVGCVLGEMLRTDGEKITQPPVAAYCSQEPWLQNSSIRDNIIGVNAYDGPWYKTVRSACGLDSDIARLAEGDRTIVGSKGMRVSGGQKKRIALARAVYSKIRAVVLDDVFSGMDPKTAAHVCQALLGRDGLLRKNKATVIVVTHNRKSKSVTAHI